MCSLWLPILSAVWREERKIMNKITDILQEKSDGSNNSDEEEQDDAFGDDESDRDCNSSFVLCIFVKYMNE